MVHERGGGGGATSQAEEQGRARDDRRQGSGGFDIKALLAWAAVGIPLAWGIWITLQKAIVLFE